VKTYGDEMFGDEVRDASVRVHLGLQPSAAPSHRRGGEIEQDEFALSFRIGERAFEIVSPGYLVRRGWHCSLLSRS